MSDGYHISKMSDVIKQAEPTAWLKAFHPSGLLVTLPILVPPVGLAPTGEKPGTMAPTLRVTNPYQSVFAAVESILAAGFLVREPGLEAGEVKEEVSHVLRRSKKNDDGSFTDVIDLYAPHPAMKFKMVSVYLNDPAHYREFEAATGIVFKTLSESITPIERGLNRAGDALIQKVGRPCSIIATMNPKYNPDETDVSKKKPKLIFARWADLPVRAAEPEASDGDSLPTVESLIKGYGTIPDERGFLKLEGYRSQLWKGATVEEQLFMKNASTYAKSRLKIA